MWARPPLYLPVKFWFRQIFAPPQTIQRDTFCCAEVSCRGRLTLVPRIFFDSFRCTRNNCIWASSVDPARVPCAHLLAVSGHHTFWAVSMTRSIVYWLLPYSFTIPLFQSSIPNSLFDAANSLPKGLHDIIFVIIATSYPHLHDRHRRWHISRPPTTPDRGVRHRFSDIIGGWGDLFFTCMIEFGTPKTAKCSY